VNWDKIELHVEHLIPGLVTGGVVAAYFKVPDMRTGLPDVVGAAILVAILYMVGTLGNILSRLVLDSVSKYTLRPLFINAFARDARMGWKYKGLQDDYSAAIDAGLTCGQPIVEAETAKRRIAGRIVRSSLVPVWVLVCGLSAQNGWAWAPLLGMLAATYFAILTLYAYAEVALYKEGRRGERVRKSIPEPPKDPSTAPAPPS